MREISKSTGGKTIRDWRSGNSVMKPPSGGKSREDRVWIDIARAELVNIIREQDLSRAGVLLCLCTIIHRRAAEEIGCLTFHPPNAESPRRRRPSSGRSVLEKSNVAIDGTGAANFQATRRWMIHAEARALDEVQTDFFMARTG